MIMMAPSNDSNVEALKKFTTSVSHPSGQDYLSANGECRCDVSDALCKLGHPSGGFLPGITMWSPERQMGATKIVGPAYTVKYVHAESAEPKLDSHYVSMA